MKISAIADNQLLAKPAGVRIWDLPTRLFHWSLVLAISGAVLTQYGAAFIGDTAMVWHFRCGYAALTLVLFRIVWGFVGTRHARFANFVRRPSAVLAYARTLNSTEMEAVHAAKAAHSAGHNPLGALSVLAMLGAVLLQAATGLFANDDIAEQGPLARLIDKSLSDQISAWHSHHGIQLVYMLVALHLLAIAYYLLRKRVNLIAPMLTGDKPHADTAHGVPDGSAEHARALACLSVCVGVVWMFATI
jgi:cytochrome b